MKRANPRGRKPGAEPKKPFVDKPTLDARMDAYMRKVADPHYYETRVRSRSALA